MDKAMRRPAVAYTPVSIKPVNNRISRNCVYSNSEMRSRGQQRPKELLPHRLQRTQSKSSVAPNHSSRDNKGKVFVHILRRGAQITQRSAGG